MHSSREAVRGSRVRDDFPRGSRARRTDVSGKSPLTVLSLEALKLNPGERAPLAQRLLEIFDKDAETEEAWAIEIELRIADVASDAVQVVPIAEALAQVRAALK
jgi:putative addiction module component (TIGR02574 family)